MTVQATPIHLSKPSSYDGKDLSKFRPWWYKIEASLESYAASFPSDAYKIHWIGSLLTDKAQTWHNQRTKQCQRMGLVDTWTGYSTALKDRFKDPSEQHRNARKMAELKYEGDTVQYITTLLDFNDVVQWSGTTFRNHISKTLPSEIIKMVYHTRGGVPSSDDEFLNTVQEAGQVYENMLQDPGMPSGKGTPTSRTEHSKSGQQSRKDTRSPSNQSQSSRNRDKQAKDKKWNNVREAVNGIDQTDVDQRKRDRVSCWRCGRDNHHTLECFARKDTNNKELPQPATTAAVKRKNSDRDEEGDEALNRDNEPQFKKAKVDAITAATRFMEMNDSDSDF
ncbi:hypothetical protein SMACR_09891 [Sordaria macrospora]|uniref:CCHC-type domain-containing protein n=2 Tax=Sordaria macrospora TaxID=5147 RepID=A0A8S8ZDH3_SORMA|nr:hypothetical protein SMACR_09891 [Sordaria macrospora]